MLFHVYAEPKPDGYFDPKTEPFGIYRQIFDPDWLLWILLPLLLLIVVGLLMLAWRIHEIPAHRADHKTMRQAELVSALRCWACSSTGSGPSCGSQSDGGTTWLRLSGSASQLFCVQKAVRWPKMD